MATWLDVPRVLLLAEAVPSRRVRQVLVVAAVVLFILVLLAVVGLSGKRTPAAPRSSLRHDGDAAPPGIGQDDSGDIDVDTIGIDAHLLLGGLRDVDSDEERELEVMLRIHGPTLSLPLSDYVCFLRRYEYVTLDARKRSLELTRKGARAAVQDDVPEEMLNELERHFADALARGVAPQHGETEERRRLALELER